MQPVAGQRHTKLLEFFHAHAHKGATLFSLGIGVKQLTDILALAEHFMHMMGADEEGLDPRVCAEG